MKSVFLADKKKATTTDAAMLRVDKIQDSNDTYCGGKFQLLVSQQVGQWLIGLFDLSESEINQA